MSIQHPRGAPLHRRPTWGFGSLLARYRTRRGWSCNELARRVGVDPSYVSRLERGDRYPARREIVEQLAAALGLDTGERDRLLLVAGYAPEWAMRLAAVATIL